jgi:AraC-like DNA-binding protein
MKANYPDLEDGLVKLTDWYCDQIRLTHTLSRYRKQSTFSASNATDVVRMHFGMKGNYKFSYQQLNKSFDLIGGHHNIMYSNGFDITVQNKTTEIETFGIQFPKESFVQFTQNADDRLKRFSERVLNGKSALLSEQWGTINTSIADVIQQILHCRYSNELKKLFLLSKTIEILVLTAESYDYANSKKENFIKTRTDKEKIIAARDLVNERLDSPLTLSEIAQAIGMNEYKLKRGFKEVFGTTVFGYLTDQRLQLAHMHLLDTEKTSAEIAYNLGYSSPQHFNQAYKNKFGFTPNSVRNNP